MVWAWQQLAVDEVAAALEGPRQQDQPAWLHDR
jgi:hypothetical protein